MIEDLLILVNLQKVQGHYKTLVMTTFVSVWLAAAIPDSLKAAAMLDWKGNLLNCFTNVCLRLCTLTTSMYIYVIFSDVLDCLEHLEL